MHLARKNSSNSWPIPQKSTKYVVVPSHAKDNGIPLLIIMRDILGLVKTRKELKIILLEEKVVVNEKLVRAENLTLQLFDTLNLKELNKFYRLTLSELGKFALENIEEKETTHKILKVINKKILKKGAVQINLSDGRNILSKEKVSVGDSVFTNLKTNKIEKILHLTDGSKVMVISGKHTGASGIVASIKDSEVIVKTKEQKIQVNKNRLIVLK